MKTLIIGATGTIGAAVAEALARHHEVIRVGRTRGDLNVDLGQPASIRALFERVGEIDAVVSAAGDVKFGTLEELDDQDYEVGLGNKLMGQINLVRFGRTAVSEGGSFTLTSGILAERPHPGSTLVSTVNAGLEGFARSAALQLPRSQRINIVSPPLVKETALKLGWGTGGMEVAQVAEAYVASVEGRMSGEVLRPHEMR